MHDDLDEPELRHSPQSGVATAVERLVTHLLSSGSLRSEAVVRAFRRVERHRFVTRWYHPTADSGGVSWSPVDVDRDVPDPEGLRQIYSDDPLVTHVDGVRATSSSTAPRLMAAMLEALDLRPGMRVLEIGTGTGYNAALLAEIVGDAGLVCTVDLRPDVVEEARASLRDSGYTSVHVDCRDGYFGFPEGAPFDRIVASVGYPDISPRWLEQLADGGMLLIPLQHGILHPLVRVWRAVHATCLGVGRIVGSSSFMPSHGALTWVNPWQSYLIGDLPAEPLWIRPALEGLPALEVPGNALQDPQHQGFHFFLALSSRELWDSGSGYGLADPGAGAVVVITACGVQAFARPSSTGALEALYERLSGLAGTWRDLGRPSAADYDLAFHSKREGPPLGSHGDAEWVIERIASWEVVRLPRSASV